MQEEGILNNKEFFFAGVKALLAQLFVFLLYVIFGPYIKFQFWGELPLIIRLFVLMFILLAAAAPFTRDFRNETRRRRELKRKREEEEN